MSDMPERPIRDGLENLRRTDYSASSKVRLTLKNQWRKVSRGRRCCGNHGEPGC